MGERIFTSARSDSVMVKAVGIGVRKSFLQWVSVAQWIDYNNNKKIPAVDNERPVCVLTCLNKFSSQSHVFFSLQQHTTHFEEIFS